jgi:tetratricopeptide (TPR) repeat protein
MKRNRRLSEAALPDAPLEFARPFSVSGADLQDAVIAAEVPPPYTLHVVRSYRLVLEWAHKPEQVTLLHDAQALREWEEDILTARYDNMSLWAPLAVIAGEICEPAEADPDRIAFACFAVTEWALMNNARGTALLFAEAAALAAPVSARHAYVAGRLLRYHGAVHEAELWLRRAARVAVWNHDRETQAHCLNSIGMLHQQAGRYAEARATLTSALRVAKNAGLQELQAASLHNLLVVSVYTGDLTAAEEHARGAFAAYPTGHPSIPKLAADVAFLWAQQGYFARALKVLQALLPRFSDPDARLRVIGHAARAAGAVGDTEAFRAAWSEAWSILESGSAEHLRPAAALELGLGALNLSAWSDAAMALDMARTAAREAHEHETIVRAEEALELLEREERADRVLRPAVRNHPSDVLARDLVETLTGGDPPAPGTVDRRFDA